MDGYTYRLRRESEAQVGTQRYGYMWRVFHDSPVDIKSNAGLSTPVQLDRYHISFTCLLKTDAHVHDGHLHA